jgi:hypothetical protein
LRRTRWYEHVIRFVFGGLSTMAAGLIAQRYGPAIGGVFLLPGYCPRAQTLMEKHETRKKKRRRSPRRGPGAGSGRTRCSQRQFGVPRRSKGRDPIALSESLCQASDHHNKLRRLYRLGNVRLITL